ncbi:SRPBCC family protein [Mangrovimonas aestuarii]|uniref:SRPBCC family protein n=1 Tax=Mangrovimonas aestuarii TaxID=3018443 RepID=UPI002379F07E|nr:SRPBCC domain-containing protein [Mangrovimonas aestuarii]
MKALSWDAFTKRIHIKAPLRIIYDCWSTEKGITSWFLESADFIRHGEHLAPEEPIQKGDDYTWRWHNWDGEEKGQILEANGKNLIKFTFAGKCIVTVKMEQKDSSVLVSLEQANIPKDEKSKLEIFYGCSNGWTFWLANLKAKLEYNIMLNETDVDLRNVGLAGYEYVNM